MMYATVIVQVFAVLFQLKAASSSSNETASGEAQMVSAAFFSCLEQHMEQMGYVLLRPAENSKYASTRDYLQEWEQDEKDAGLL